MPDVDYLSASLELNESGNGEMGKLTVSPLFDQPRIQVAVHPADEAEDADEVFVELNRAQIECLADFLAAWLKRKRSDQAPDPPS